MRGAWRRAGATTNARTTPVCGSARDPAHPNRRSELEAGTVGSDVVLVDGAEQARPVDAGGGQRGEPGGVERGALVGVVTPVESAAREIPLIDDELGFPSQGRAGKEAHLLGLSADQGGPVARLLGQRGEQPPGVAEARFGSIGTDGRVVVP